MSVILQINVIVSYDSSHCPIGSNAALGLMGNQLRSKKDSICRRRSEPTVTIFRVIIIGTLGSASLLCARDGHRERSTRKLSISEGLVELTSVGSAKLKGDSSATRF